MAIASKIEWCDHTFNPWWGCEEISPGCDHCYAKTLAKRVGYGNAWHGEFRPFRDKHWQEPLKWNAAPHPDGRRWRVFCASMCDWADNREPETLGPLRARLWDVVRATPNIEWLMLTKRIGNAPRMLPPDWGDGYDNVTLMITVVNQDEADRDIPKLLRVPARRRGLSLEPLLGPVDLTRVVLGTATTDGLVMNGIPIKGTTFTLNALKGAHSLGWARLDWLIVGGESGRGARVCSVEWVRDIVRQGREAGVPVFVKQIGARPTGWCVGRLHDDLHLRDREDYCDVDEAHEGTACVAGCRLLSDRKGGDPSEWPTDLRVREWPTQERER